MVCLFLKAEGQQKAFFCMQPLTVSVLNDTTKQTIQQYQQGQGHSNYSCFLLNQIDNIHRLFDCYSGKVFVFNDTLKAADFATPLTNIYTVTPHTAVLSTTKRNILMGGVVFQYDLATQTLIPPSTYGDPLQIMNTSTGKVSLTLNYVDFTGWYDVLPGTQSILTTPFIKIIVK